MLRKPHLVLLIAVALVVLVLLALPEQTRSRVRMAIASLFLPLFGLASTAQNAVDRAAASAVPRGTLVARIRELEEQNRRFQLEAVEARAAARETDRLRAMAGYAPRSPWKLKPARVIGRDPANWWRGVHVDLGAREGMMTNLPVLTPEGLVGKVAEVGPWTSRVVLVGDPNCPVAAALADSGSTGIVRGVSGGDIEGAIVDLSFLPRSAVVRPGMRVVTSGQGGVFPSGIQVGEVIDSRAVGEGVYLDARVRLSVNLGALDHVWIKVP
ncbi:MAG: rod shape-determining protein MreC [Verrucomicrobiales bacterium]|nr:rod shape-determining protein MreC [Verrucomicrobiales bacterium]